MKTKKFKFVFANECCKCFECFFLDVQFVPTIIGTIVNSSNIGICTRAFNTHVKTASKHLQPEKISMHTVRHI